MHDLTFAKEIMAVINIIHSGEFTVDSIEAEKT